jgi:hypothetical protein
MSVQRSMMWSSALVSILCLSITGVNAEPPVLTSLSDPSIHYQTPEKPYAVLKRADVEAVVVGNRAVNDMVLSGHRAGYNGIASLKHTRRQENLFVPLFAGLNFEHIHDGTMQEGEVLFEPRHFPMELRVVNGFTAELYQKPTPHYGLESCTRYQLMDDGTIEMTHECIPRRRSFTNGYIGLFWASYIHKPESLDIHFKGYLAKEPPASDWVRGVTPAHGQLSTHVAHADQREFAYDPTFPLTLVFNLSHYRYSEPWYYGVSHGMALVQMFRPRDKIRLSQSPSGGGPANPAWDFQFLIPKYEVGKRYQIVMRAMYLPYESPEQIERATLPHRKQLAGGSKR